MTAIVKLRVGRGVKKTMCCARAKLQICVLLIIIVNVSFVRSLSFVPQTPAETVNLNTMLLNKFDENLAWLTRVTDLNGSVYDAYEPIATEGTYESLSTPHLIYSLAYLYEQTNNPFYLAYLRTLLDGIIENPTNYIAVSGVGTIFFAFPFITGTGLPTADKCIMPTAYCGYAATKLYAWTNEAKYKNLADRIANESLNWLSVPPMDANNGTYLAWSTNYYSDRDVEHAKLAVNRQTTMAVFYAEYGKRINATFENYVDQIIDWTWLSQLNFGGLAYNIGATTVQYDYSAWSIYHALEAYKALQENCYSATLKAKIANCTKFLRDDRASFCYYLGEAAYAGCFAKAWQTAYFQDCINKTVTKSLYYGILNRGIHLTSKGFRAELGMNNWGFRWGEQYMTSLFNGYPLPESDFDFDAEGFGFMAVVTPAPAVGKYRIYGNGKSLQVCDSDALRNGKDGGGVALKSAGGWAVNFQLFTGMGVSTTSTTMNYTHYIKVFASWTAKNVKVTSYLYPTGIFVGDVSGASKTSEFFVTNVASWHVMAENGSAWQLSTFTTGKSYLLSNYIMVWFNDTDPARRITIMAKAPSTTWGYRLLACQHLNNTATNYRMIYAYLNSWGKTHISCFQNGSTVFSVLKNLIDSYDTTQPLTFDDMWNTYNDKISELQPEASWNSLYQNAQSTEVKLIGHNKPQSVSISSWAYASGKLAFTISGATGQTSKTLIYCGLKGQPKQVNGATASYAASSNILTVTATHSSPARILIYWKFPGDIDGDNDVDANDLYLLAVAYGSHVGDPSYNSNSDIDCDGDTDADDLHIFAENYGNTNHDEL